MRSVISNFQHFICLLVYVIYNTNIPVFEDLAFIDLFFCYTPILTIKLSDMNSMDDSSNTTES